MLTVQYTGIMAVRGYGTHEPCKTAVFLQTNIWNLSGFIS
jgi:hypothetical protein